MQEPDVYGSRSINWDFTLYPTSDTSGLLSEPTALPLSASSSAALTSNLTSPELSLNDTSEWNAFALTSSGPDQYLGDDSQLLMGGSTPFTTAEQSLNIMAMSKGLGNLQDASFSTPMVKGKTFTLLYLVRLTPHRSFFVWFFHKSAASCLFLSGSVFYNSAVQLSDQSTCSRGL